MCLTECPNLNKDLCGIEMVGSSACHDCKHFVSDNIINQVVTCDFDKKDSK